MRLARNASTERGRRVRRGFAGVVALTALATIVALAGCGGSASTRAAGSARPTPTMIPAIPTYTPRPPTPTATAQELAFASLERQALGNLVVDVQVTYDAGTRSVQVNTTVGGTVPNSDPAVAAAQEQTKNVCFRAEEAMWNSGTPFSQVAITVAGPILDQYAQATNGAYGAAMLTATQAKRFTWSNLTPDAAWNQYDNVFLRPNFNDAS